MLTVLESREAKGGRRRTRRHAAQASVAVVVAGIGIIEGQGRCSGANGGVGSSSGGGAAGRINQSWTVHRDGLGKEGLLLRCHILERLGDGTGAGHGHERAALKDTSRGGDTRQRDRATSRGRFWQFGVCLWGCWCHGNGRGCSMAF